MGDDNERSRAFGEFMRNSRIDATRCGEIKSAPDELEQVEKTAAGSIQAEGSKAQDSDPRPVGFLFSRDITAEEAAAAIREIIEREERESAEQ